MPKGNASQGEMMWMSVVSVLIPAIFLVCSLVYVAFYADGYSLFQKIVIVVVALIVVGAAEALLWMVWAGRKGLLCWPQSK
jgi:hypothetical protein